MSNLQKSEDSIQTRSKDILAFIPIALERTGTDLTKEQIVNMSADISNEFPKLSTDFIRSAMKKGGLGHFGPTYKLTTQEVCIWIRKELKWRRENYADGRKKITF